jgi:aminopeptidase N
MKNLTRAEAQARAALLRVTSYDVALDLTGDTTGFGSEVTIRFSCREPDASTFVELDAELLTAELNGAPLDAPLHGNRLTLRGLAADNTLRVTARCAYSRTGEGLHRFVDPADGLVYLSAQSFLDDAQRMFACFDQPDLKAVFRLTVSAPQDWTVVANSRATQEEGARWSFAATEPISTYLFHVSAGPWHHVHDRHDGIELGLYCRQSLARHLDADELFEMTKQCLDFQQETFGRRYPFGDSYDQLFVPEFNAGAMENPGAVTFSEDFVFRSRVTESKRRTRAMVIAHEMSHMWFGDLVTMRWWDDLWLNESFAELMGFHTVDRATRFGGGWVDFCTSRKAWGYRADQLPTTHPVSGEVADNRSALLNFDGISYAKGASVLRQLMATIGEDVFFAGVRAYLDRHAFANTSFADLLAELGTASGRDLGGWADAWLRTPGVSTLRVQVDGSAEPWAARVVQESAVLREHRIGVGLYDADGASLRRRDRLEVDLAGSVAVLPLAPEDLPDLLLPNDGDLTFAKLRFDDRSLATVLSSLRALPDPLARALCWAALWDATRDAELPAAAFVDAVLTGVDGEQDPAVVETLLTQARIAATLYTSDGAPLRERLAQASLTAARTAEPGSDLQLTRARTFAAACAGDTAGMLEQWLAGDDVPPDLALDTDLRWLLVEQLAALGRLDDAAIDAELARDDTAAGALHAATSRAARPDADAKERAWTAATTDASLSNKQAEAVARGCWQPGQDALLAPYVERYLAVVPELWQTRSPQMAQELTLRLFPSTLVDPAVVARVDTLLAGDHPAGLHRVVLEQRADLERAVRARALT